MTRSVHGMGLDFESTDSTLFALLGLISVSQGTEQWVDALGFSEGGASAEREPDLDEPAVNALGPPDRLLDLLLGCVSLTTNLRIAADETFPPCPPCPPCPPTEPRPEESLAESPIGSGDPNGSGALLR